MMTLTIPEGWLGEARYPVVVDPVIGSNTIGAYRTYSFLDEYDYTLYLNALARDPATSLDYWCDDRQLYLEELMVLNRQATPLKLQGTYNAYLYADETWSYPRGSTIYYAECYAFPMLYSGVNNKPKRIQFSNTTMATIKVSPATPAKWNKAPITFGTAINANTDIWFGFIGDMSIGCRFDYGEECYGIYGYYLDSEWQLNDYQSILECIEDCGLTDISGEADCFTETGNYHYNMLPGARHDFKVSMYLELPAQSYVKTLTQGVKLTDKRHVTGAYKRNLAQTVKGTTVLGKTGTFFRTCVMNVKNSTILNRVEGFYRKCVMDVHNTALLVQAEQFMRTVVEWLETAIEVSNRRAIHKSIPDEAASESVLTRQEEINRSIGDALATGDYSACSVVWLRRLPEQGTATDQNLHIGAYIRGMYTAAGSLAETDHTAEYYRKQTETVNAQGVSLRHLCIFIRLLTTGLLRDYIIRRFLKSNEELVLKSAVCREIEIESTLH
jgi:hypothetical protein